MKLNSFNFLSLFLLIFSFKAFSMDPAPKEVLTIALLQFAGDYVASLSVDEVSKQILTITQKKWVATSFKKNKIDGKALLALDHKKVRAILKTSDESLISAILLIPSDLLEGYVKLLNSRVVDIKPIANPADNKSNQ